MWLQRQYCSWLFGLLPTVSVMAIITQTPPKANLSSSDGDVTFDVTVTADCPTSASIPNELPVPSSVFCSKSGPLFWGFESFLSHLDTNFCSKINMSRMILCGISNFQEACKAHDKKEWDSNVMITQYAINYICDFRPDTNWPCLINHLVPVRECVKRDVMERKRELKVTSTNDTISLDDCELVLIFTLCLWESLIERCGEYSTSVMIGTINPYLKPQKCYLPEELRSNLGHNLIPISTVSFTTLLAIVIAYASTNQ